MASAEQVVESFRWTPRADGHSQATRRESRFAQCGVHRTEISESCRLFERHVVRQTDQGILGSSQILTQPAVRIILENL